MTPIGDAIEGGHEADDRERVAPARQRHAERQEADEADHAGLDPAPLSTAAAGIGVAA